MPEITTRLISRDTIDDFLHSEFKTSANDSVNTTSQSYTNMPDMVLTITPPIECDMMINFMGTFNQSGEITSLESMHVGIFIDGILKAESPFLSWIYIDWSGDWPDIYKEQKMVPVIYTAKGLSATEHTIRIKYKTGQATANVDYRSLQCVLFHR